MRTRLRDSMRGDPFELQRDDTVPRSLILQEIGAWYGHEGVNLLELCWDQPTEDDQRFEGRYRDFRNFDLGYRHDASRWFDRPREQPSSLSRDAFTLRLRKWSRLHLDAGYEGTHERRRGPTRDRDSRAERLAADAKVWLGTTEADLRVRATSYLDALEPTDDHDDTSWRLRVGRDIGPNTHLRAAVRTDERRLAETGETQRDLALSLSTRTYDLFERRGLKLRLKAHYQTRPSTFQRTQGDDESLRVGGQVSYDVMGGAIEAGYRKTHRESERLDRQGIETLLENPATTRAELARRYRRVFPTERRAWVKLAMPFRKKARVFARYSDRETTGAPGSDWVAGGSAPLEYTQSSILKTGLSFFPFEGVDLRLERQLEDRAIRGRGDHRAGQSQQLENGYVNLHLSFIPRLQLDFQAANFDLRHGDEGVQAEAVDEVTNYALDLTYSLGRALSLEGSYQRLNHDGVSGATQDIVGLALDFGRTGQPLHARLSYVLDDFLDDSEPDSTTQTRVIQLSAGAKF